MRASIRVLAAWAALTVHTPAHAAEQATGMQALHAALDQLVRQNKFSGAVVVQGPDGVLFARGYGLADPFTGRRFTPETPVDSASLAKPVTAAIVLSLAIEGKVDLDAPVHRYLPVYPHEATVRQLLSHSAGLPAEEALEPLANKTNEQLLDEIATRRLPPLFEPGKRFTYCNLCFSTLAALLERVTGDSYLSVARGRVGLPAGVTLRPRRLADWSGRAIGYRRKSSGELERADSYEDEAFYGTANLSISAAQLAQWGAQWWEPQLARLDAATTPALVDGKLSGLTFGNWYYAPQGRARHYLGHHEGFHHMLYWDADRRRSIAMVSNNTLAAGLQQRLQRALIAFVEERPADAVQELGAEMPDTPVRAGRYLFSSGESVVVASEGARVSVERRGIEYPAYRIAAGIRYIPGLDTYIAGASGGGLHWLNLYEDFTGEPK